MLVKEFCLGPTQIRIFDDECVPREEVPEILGRVARIYQEDYAAREIRRRREMGGSQEAAG